MGGLLATQEPDDYLAWAAAKVHVWLCNSAAAKVCGDAHGS